MANFTAGPLASADLNAALENYQPVNAQTGTTYTLALTDAGGLVTASSTSAQTYTIPPNSSVAFATGVHVDVMNINTGTVTLAGGSGVTLNGCTIVPPKARVHLIKQATNTWYAQLVVDRPGSVLVASSTVSASSGFSIDGCFTSAFDLYVVRYSLASASGTVNLLARMRAAGVDNTSSNYYDTAGTSGGTSMILATVTTTGGWGVTDLWFPAVAVPTFHSTQAAAAATAPAVANVAGSHNVSTAYDGITITPSASTLTGSVYVFGISKG